MKVAELIRLIETDGWRLARTRGSHRQYRHATKPGLVTIAGKPSAERPEGYTELGSEAGEAEVREKPRRYMVVLERGENGWGAHVPDLPGCAAASATREEVLALVREAIAFHIDGLKEEGLPVPEPSSEAEVVEVGAA